MHAWDDSPTSEAYQLWQSENAFSTRVFAQRKPLLLFVFVGVLLLRLATRTFVVLLFQEPPRNTREPRLATPWASRK